MKKITKENKGITLIALVITIVVLIILAGILISITLGNNGLFTKAKQGVADYKDAIESEKGLLQQAEDIVNNYTGDTPATYTFGQEVTVGGENFYVIGEDANTVKLFAKYPLISEEIENHNYDESDTIEDYLYSQITGMILEDFSYDNAVEIADIYAQQKFDNATGRLMTVSEAEALATNNIDVLCGVMTSWLSYDSADYWLSDGVAKYYYEGENPDDGTCIVTNGLDDFEGDTMNIRPVIVIQKSGTTITPVQ